MRTTIATHDLLPEGLALEGLSIGDQRVRTFASPRTSEGRCPVCGRDSSRVHSHYRRTASDLPWHGISVEFEVRARRFFCDGVSCGRRIFCERLQEIAPHARKTGRPEVA